MVNKEYVLNRIECLSELLKTGLEEIKQLREALLDEEEEEEQQGDDPYDCGFFG